MAGRAIQKILAPQTIVAVISRVKRMGTVLQDMLGMGIGGPNTTDVSGRQFQFDVFNETRELATGRAPNTNSKVVKPQKVGSVLGEFPRQAESIVLDMEKIHNLRVIGGPSSMIDKAGQTYIQRQEMFLAQRFMNTREFQVAAMLRGSYTYTSQADGSLIHDFSGGGQTIDFQLPASNKNQLDLIGGGNIIGTSWADAAAPIADDIEDIDSAFLQISGRPLQSIVVSSGVWKEIRDNTQIKALAGTANAPVASRDRDRTDGRKVAKLGGLPQYDFIVMNHGLDVGTGPTFTKLIPDTAAVFLPEWDAEIGVYGQGSEIVIEETNRAEAERFGFYAWAEKHGNPAAYDLQMLNNGIPFAYNPAAWAFGTVVF